MKVRVTITHSGNVSLGSQCCAMGSLGARLGHGVSAGYVHGLYAEAVPGGQCPTSASLAGSMSAIANIPLDPNQPYPWYLYHFVNIFMSAWPASGSLSGSYTVEPIDPFLNIHCEHGPETIRCLPGPGGGTCHDDDGAEEPYDNCPCIFNPDQSDTDQDGVGDACDNCVFRLNTNQGDTDDDDQEGKA